ncbi:MAG: GtrA family protein [Anaeromyxobacteraceae bacterium]
MSQNREAPPGGRRQFAAYLAVGVLNTAVGYSIFALLVFLGLHYTLAVLLSTVLGVAFNFQTIGRLVFGSNDPSLVFRFVGVYAVTYGLNVAGLRALQASHLGPYVAGALLLAPMAVVSFFLHRGFVFRREVAGQ